MSRIGTDAEAEICVAEFSPRDYQRAAIEAVCEKPRIGLFLDMGLGKTVSTLTA